MESLANHDAERALVSSLIHNNASIDRVRVFLKEEHFSSPVYAAVYRVLCSLFDSGKSADFVILKSYFESNEILRAEGGSDLLKELADSCITIINSEHYADLIYTLYMRRCIVDISKELSTSAAQSDIKSTPHDAIVRAEERLYSLQNARVHRNSFFSPISTFMNAAVQTVTDAMSKSTPGVPTGFKDLDNVLGGLHRSDLLILAARPAMGKTALVTNIAYNVSRHLQKEAPGMPVAYFSLEMSGEQLAARILSSESHVPSEAMRKGRVSKKELEMLRDTSETLQNLPLYIDDTPSLTVMDLKSRCRRLSMMKNGLSLIVVDYLQLLQGYKSESRVQEISEITRGLKMLAKEINVPVIALSQLSRAVEMRDDKKPRLADLRESGSIEQDADLVLFIYRKGYYQKDNNPEAEVIIAKHRNGPVTQVKLHFDVQTTTFKNAISSATDYPSN